MASQPDDLTLACVAAPGVPSREEPPPLPARPEPLELPAARSGEGGVATATPVRRITRTR